MGDGAAKDASEAAAPAESSLPGDQGDNAVSAPLPATARKLDINSFPKYCPQCEKLGLKSKVKKFRTKDGHRVIMCKNGECPWPFSEYSKEEVTFPPDPLEETHPSPEKKKKKRKKEVSSPSQFSGEEAEARTTSGLTSSPSHKKQKVCLSPGPTTTPTITTTSSDHIEHQHSDVSRATDVGSCVQETQINPDDTELGQEKADPAADGIDGIHELKIGDSISTKSAENPAAESGAKEHLPSPVGESTPKKEPRKLVNLSSSLDVDISAATIILADDFEDSSIQPHPSSASETTTIVVTGIQGVKVILPEETSSVDDPLPQEGDASKVEPSATKFAVSVPTASDDSEKRQEPTLSPMEAAATDENDSKVAPSNPSSSGETANASQPKMDESQDVRGEPSKPQQTIASAEGQMVTKPANDDDQYFKAIPIAIRQPIRLPKHASSILNSRVARDEVEATQSEKAEDIEDNDGCDSDDSLDVNLMDGTDSELESLVSECSTMSTISDTASSQDGAGRRGSDAGIGKVRRRGKKKKRKDRRRLHVGKCSKDRPRVSDIADVVTPFNNDPNRFTPMDDNKDGGDIADVVAPAAPTKSPVLETVGSVPAPTADKSVPAPTTGAEVDGQQEQVEETEGIVSDDILREVKKLAVSLGLLRDENDIQVGNSVYKDPFIEISLMNTSADPSAFVNVGSGPLSVQFIFHYPLEEGEQVVYKPVYLTTPQEVTYLAILVKGAADRFLTRNCPGVELINSISKELTIMAKSSLPVDIVRYIDRCFTKKGMKDNHLVGDRPNGNNLVRGAKRSMNTRSSSSSSSKPEAKFARSEMATRNKNLSTTPSGKKGKIRIAVTTPATNDSPTADMVTPDANPTSAQCSSSVSLLSAMSVSPQTSSSPVIKQVEVKIQRLSSADIELHSAMSVTPPKIGGRSRTMTVSSSSDEELMINRLEPKASAASNSTGAKSPASTWSREKSVREKLKTAESSAASPTASDLADSGFKSKSEEENESRVPPRSPQAVSVAKVLPSSPSKKQTSVPDEPSEVKTVSKASVVVKQPSARRSIRRRNSSESCPSSRESAASCPPTVTQQSTSTEADKEESTRPATVTLSLSTFSSDIDGDKSVTVSKDVNQPSGLFEDVEEEDAVAFEATSKSKTSNNSPVVANKADDDKLFKQPLAPVRGYRMSPRHSISFESPKRAPSSPGQASATGSSPQSSSSGMSPGHPEYYNIMGPSPKYCYILCDPMSPMPATPKSSHEEPEEDGANETNADSGRPASPPTADTSGSKGSDNESALELPPLPPSTSPSSDSDPEWDGEKIQRRGTRSGGQGGRRRGLGGRANSSSRKSLKGALDNVSASGSGGKTKAASNTQPREEGVNESPKRGRKGPTTKLEEARSPKGRKKEDVSTPSSSGQEKNDQRPVSRISLSDSVPALDTESLVDSVRSRLESRQQANKDMVVGSLNVTTQDAVGQSADVVPKGKPCRLESLSNRVLLNTGIGIEAVAVMPEEPVPTPLVNCPEPAEVDVELSTLTLIRLNKDPTGYSVMDKFGTGFEDQFQNLDLLEDDALNSSSVGGRNSFDKDKAKKGKCVFHVSRDIHTTLPVTSDYLEVSEKSQTKIFLTSESDQIDAHGLKLQVKCPKSEVRNRQIRRSEGLCGPGWFMWRDWRVDVNFIVDFNIYLYNLTNKWGRGVLHSLEEERQANDCDPSIEKIFAFFMQVYLKANFVRTNYKCHLNQCLDIISDKYTMSSVSFINKMKRNPPTPLPESQQSKPTPSMREATTSKTNGGMAMASSEMTVKVEPAEEPESGSAAGRIEGPSIKSEPVEYDDALIPISASRDRTRSGLPNIESCQPKSTNSSELIHGPGWFMWRNWRVDELLVVKFTEYLQNLTQKWNLNELQSLEKERAVNMGSVQKNVEFFVQVFVKANFIHSMFKIEMPRCLDFIRDKFNMENKVFLSWIKSLPPDYVTHQIRSLASGLSQFTPEQQLDPMNDGKRFVRISPAEVKVIQKEGPAKTVPHATQRSNSMEDPGSPCGPASVLSIQLEEPPTDASNIEANGAEISVKQEPLSTYSDSSQYGASVRVIDSVLSETMASVQPTFVDTDPKSQTKIGSGRKCVQFFFENPEDGSKVAFKPVYVDNDDEVRCVVALVTERAGEFRRRLGYHQGKLQYYTDAVRALSILKPEVRKYIYQCFTKSGIKLNRNGGKKRSYTRSRRKRDPKTFDTNIKEEVNPDTLDDQEQVAEGGLDNEEESIGVEVEDVQEEPIEEQSTTYKALDDEHVTRQLERRVFGVTMPKVKQKKKQIHNRVPNPDLIGPGGRNAHAGLLPSKEVMLSRVMEAMGDTNRQNESNSDDKQNDENPGGASQLCLNSLFKGSGKRNRRGGGGWKRGAGRGATRRRKASPVSPEPDSSTDEDIIGNIDEDFTVNIFDCKESGQNVRKSARLNKKYINHQKAKVVMAETNSTPSAHALGSQEEEIPAEIGPAEVQSQETTTASAMESVTSPTADIVVTVNALVDKTNFVSDTSSSLPNENTCDNEKKQAALTNSSINNATSSNVERPKSSSGRKSRSADLNVSQEELDAMLRCISRSEGDINVTAPGRANSRAGSSLGGRCRKEFGVRAIDIPEPDRDSPVLTPRLRHKEKLEQQRSISRQGLTSPLPATIKTTPKKIDSAAAPTSSKTEANSTTATKPPAPLAITTSLSNFDLVNVRKSKQDRVARILARQKKKAEKLEKKKYRGFGQQASENRPEETEEERKQRRLNLKREKQQRRQQQQREERGEGSANHNHHHKPPQVTTEESDLIASLLRDAESALRQKESEEEEASTTTVQPDVFNINDFEETQTLFRNAGGIEGGVEEDDDPLNFHI